MKILKPALKLLFLLPLLVTAAEVHAQQVIKSTDGVTEVTVPSSWKTETTLNDVASLQVANFAEENYLIVITEKKTDFAGDMNLTKYSEITREPITKAVTNVKQTGPKNVSLGKSAVQYEITGTINNLNAVWLHTAIETDKYYHQILVWTLADKYSVNKPILEAATLSFKEISSAATAPSTAPTEAPKSTSEAPRSNW